MTTRAHNTLLVNGSGQAVRTPEADGATTAFADFPAFGYVAGDAGNPKIYGGKLTRFQREIVFVKPDAVINIGVDLSLLMGRLCGRMSRFHEPYR